jgi:hypothetical protein
MLLHLLLLLVLFVKFLHQVLSAFSLRLLAVEPATGIAPSLAGRKVLECVDERLAGIAPSPAGGKVLECMDELLMGAKPTTLTSR